MKLNNIKNYIIGGIIAGASMNASAQQTPIYNHHFLNQTFYNPSTVGLGDQINTMLINKSYLTGIDGRPNTLFLSLDAPMNTDKMGVGLNVFNDKLGISSKTGVYGAFSYKAKFDKDHYISFGTSLGFLQFSINEDEMELDNESDPLLVNKKFSTSGIDANFGITYNFKNFRLGLSATQLLGSKYKITDNVSFNQERVFIGTASYKMYFNSKKTFSVMPMVLARYSQESQQPQEGMIILGYKDMLWLAPSYKSTGVAGATITANIYNGFKIGYSYETAMTEPVSGYQNGAHEIMVGYSFDIRSKNNQNQLDKIEELNRKMEEMELKQQQKNKLQDEILKKQQENIDENSKDIKENEDKIQKVDEDLQKTQEELEKLKKELKDAGILKEENASDFGSEQKGYYIVIASVKDKNISEERMKSDYLDRGFKRMYNQKTGWHYAYKARYDDFNEALKDLRETRKGEFNDAWIHVLK